jgi:hypothetical protein
VPELWTLGRRDEFHDMSDDTLIWIGLFFIASSPFILALVLRRFFPRARHRLICHLLSGALLVFLAAMCIHASRAYRLAGNQDDGSSSMAAFLLIAAALVMIPENLLLYLPWRTKR